MDKRYLYIIRRTMALVGHVALPIRDARNLKVLVNLVVIALDGCTPYYVFVSTYSSGSHCRSLWHTILTTTRSRCDATT